MLWPKQTAAVRTSSRWPKEIAAVRTAAVCVTSPLSIYKLLRLQSGCGLSVNHIKYYLSCQVAVRTAAVCLGQIRHPLSPRLSPRTGRVVRPSDFNQHFKRVFCDQIVMEGWETITKLFGGKDVRILSPNLDSRCMEDLLKLVVTL